MNQNQIELRFSGKILKQIIPLLKQTITFSDGMKVPVILMDHDGSPVWFPERFLYTKDLKDEVITGLFELVNDPNVIKTFTPVVIEEPSIRNVIDDVNPDTHPLLYKNFLAPFDNNNDKRFLARLMYDPPVRVAHLDARPVVPNPHLDKSHLTPHELREVVAWALERSDDENWPKSLVDIPPIQSAPRSAAEKLTATLGEAVYGENNYIGPGKTGNLDGSHDLAYIVAHAPALNDADARARAHDIGLTVGGDPVHVDSILPPIARTAQVFRPGFYSRSEQPPPRISRVRDRDTLSKDGDVEQNPGPKYTYANVKVAVEALQKLISDPIASSSFLSELTTATRLDDFMYYARNGPSTHRTGLDNQSDLVLHDDHVFNFNAFQYTGTTANGNFSMDQIVTYVIGNKEPKTGTSVIGEMGTSLAAALSNTDTFTGMLRTNTNVVHGDALLSIFTRIPNVDYGDYIACAKLLAYEMLKMPLSGTLGNGCGILYTTSRHDPTVAIIPDDIIYPNSLGWVPAGPETIDAIYLTQTALSQVLLGNLTLPAGWILDGGDIAWIIVNNQLDPSVITYSAITHVEFPFYGREAPEQSSTMQVNNGPPVVINRGTRNYLDFTRIVGPRNKVAFVTGTNDPTLTCAGVGIAPVVLNAYAAGVVPADIKQVMVTLYVGGILVNPETSAYFNDLFTWYLSFMDASDWANCLMLVSGIIQGVKFPVLRLDPVAGTSVGLYTSTLAGANIPVPSTDAQVPIRDLEALNVANQALLSGLYGFEPFCNGLGHWTNYSNGTAMPVVPVNLPRDVTNASGTLQQTNFLLKWGQMMRIYKKSSLTGTTINFPKCRVKNLFYVCREIAKIVLQLDHNYFQEGGLQFRDLFSASVMRDDHRMKIWTTLAQNKNAMFKLLTGVCAIRLAVPNRVITQLTPAALNGYYSMEAWLNSPIYLSNHVTRLYEEDYYYAFKPACTYILGTATGTTGDWSVAPSVGQNIHGIPTGGNTTCVVDLFKLGGGKPDVVEEKFKNMFALFRFTSLLNPTPISQLIGCFPIRRNGVPVNNTPIYWPRLVYSCSYNFLRWSSTTAPSDTYRQTRQNLFWTLPDHPPLEDTQNATALTIGLTSQQIIVNQQRGIEFRGQGSADFGLVSVTGVLTSFYTPSSSDSPF